MCTHGCRCPWKSEKGIGSLGAGTSDGCEPSNKDAWNRT